jgi:septal ring factor EnvC (AmiA/AmiB activator)
MKPVFCAFFIPAFFCLSRALYAEQPSPDFASIASNLDTLEALIQDTLSNNEELTRQLRDLRANLNEREALLDRQENSLTTLRQQLQEMSQTYRERSALSEKYERSSKFWKTFTLVGIPAAALISGLTVGLVIAR